MGNTSSRKRGSRYYEFHPDDINMVLPWRHSNPYNLSTPWGAHDSVRYFNRYPMDSYGNYYRRNYDIYAPRASHGYREPVNVVEAHHPDDETEWVYDLFADSDSE
ncbi:hypothetical protein OQA88_9720 [Cercophora sp. LCS_1]